MYNCVKESVCGEKMILNPISQGPESDYIRVPEAACEKLIQTGNTVYLAVYLYALGLFYKGKTDVSNGYIADALHLNIIDVVNAFLFCVSEGLLKVHNFTSVSDADFDIEFCFDVKLKTRQTDFRPHYNGGEISRKIAENSKLAQTYKIVSGILGKNLSSSDIELLYSMYDYYGLPAEVIAVMIEYFASKGKTTMRSLEREAQKWSEFGVDSVLKAKQYIKKREDLLTYASQVRRVIGANERKLTTKELEYINKWQNDLKMQIDDIRAAYERTVENTGKVSFAYMNRILENRHKEKTSGEPPKKPLPNTKTTTKSRYNYEEIERKTFLNVTRKGGDKDGV